MENNFQGTVCFSLRFNFNIEAPNKIQADRILNRIHITYFNMLKNILMEDCFSISNVLATIESELPCQEGK